MKPSIPKPTSGHLKLIRSKKNNKTTNQKKQKMKSAHMNFNISAVQPPHSSSPAYMGVQDLVARGYFIPGRKSQSGWGWRLRSVSHVVGPHQGSGLIGLVVALGHAKVP